MKYVNLFCSSQMMSQVTSPTVLVTGAATNTGLGIARAFAAQGFHVFMADMKSEVLTQAASIGRLAKGFVVDLTSPAHIDGIFNQLAQQASRLDVLVNNAAHLGCNRTFVEMTLEEFDRTLAVNLRATFYVSQLAAKWMIRQGGGSIVHLSSNTAGRAIRRRCDYIAGKGGIEAMTRAMAVELGPDRIRVNAVAPGYIHTDRWSVLPTDQVSRRRRNLPAGHEASIEDVAQAVLFLAGPASQSITGTVLTVDAGASAQLLPVDCET